MKTISDSPNGESLSADDKQTEDNFLLLIMVKRVQEKDQKHNFSNLKRRFYGL